VCVCETYSIGAEVVLDEDPEDSFVLNNILLQSELDVDAGGAQHEIQLDFTPLFGLGFVMAALQ